MSDEHTTFIGFRHQWGGETPFSISRADRRHHLYLIGKTGAGKTTLLRNLIVQDIEAGEGVGVIDPHGDLASELLDFIPPWRTDHVVYFNPADQDYPIAFNLLTAATPDSRHLVASGIVSAFKSIWRDSWGPRLEYILYATCAALLECENVSVLGIQRMLSDASYRAWVLRQVHDPAVLSFWTNEFARYDDRFLQEVIAPIQNKVGQLLMASPIRNIFGQVRSKIDPRFIMDNRRILIANLSKGRLGEDKANLLGALLVTQFQRAAMERADTPEHDRIDFFLHLDEFHNFSTDSFAAILAEARKYRLSLTLSHQYVAQLRDEVRDAVFGNVGSLISFRVGESDASRLEREFGGAFTGSQFADLGNHEIFAKLLMDGVHREPFFGTTFPPISPKYQRRDTIIQRSRERYGSPRLLVEQKIRRWLNLKTGGTSTAKRLPLRRPFRR